MLISWRVKFFVATPFDWGGLRGAVERICRGELGDRFRDPKS